MWITFAMDSISSIWQLYNQIIYYLLIVLEGEAFFNDTTCLGHHYWKIMYYMKKIKKTKKQIEKPEMLVQEEFEQKVKRLENEIQKLLVTNDVRFQIVPDYKVIIVPTNQ